MSSLPNIPNNLSSSLEIRGSSPSNPHLQAVVVVVLALFRLGNASSRPKVCQENIWGPKKSCITGLDDAKIYRKPLCLMLKSMDSGFDFPLKQSGGLVDRLYSTMGGTFAWQKEAMTVWGFPQMEVPP